MDRVEGAAEDIKQQQKRRGGACRIRFPSRTHKSLAWGGAGLPRWLCACLRCGREAAHRYACAQRTRTHVRTGDLGAIWRLLVAECSVDDAASRQQPRVHMCDTRIQKQGEQARLLVVQGHPSSGRVFNGRASRRS